MKPHRARILAMQAVFQQDFHNRTVQDLKKFDWIDYNLPEEDKKFAEQIFLTTIENKEAIDTIIREYSHNWDFDRISPVNKAILRISFCQFLYMNAIVPPRVVIDEAVKIAREYAEDDANRFINGILDAYYKSNMKPASI